MSPRATCILLPLLLLFSACNEEPSPVTGLTASLEQGKIRLAWTNPAGSAFARVVIRRTEGAAPADMAGGTEIYRGTAITTLDSGLEHGRRYGYAAFAVDDTGAAAAPAVAEITCRHDPFTLAVWPDTQYLSLGFFPILDFNANWLVQQKKARNIVFMLHEGDITHKNTAAEWTNAKNALAKLDGDVPYALNVGNHDMGQGSTGTTLFNKTFPLSKFSGLPHFGGSYPAGKMDNAYYRFSGAGIDWLIISLIYDPSADVLTWADSVAAKHPRHRIIVLTHAYLAPGGTRTAIGERIWKGLAAKHVGVTLVLNGHYIGGVASRLVSDGEKGNKVYQMFANYQTAEVSGYGMMRLLRLDRVKGSISVASHAPIKAWSLTDAKNKFELSGVDLGVVP